MTPLQRKTLATLARIHPRGLMARELWVNCSLLLALLDQGLVWRACFDGVRDTYFATEAGIKAVQEAP